MEALDGADDGNVGHGKGETKKNYMGLIIARLQKDIEDIINVCKKCLVLSLKRNVSDDSKND